MSRTRQSAIHDPRGRGAAAVTTLSWDYADGVHVPEHFHDDDQLVYAVRGVMTVRTPDGLWVVPPRRAVWIPAKVAHAIDMSGAVTMKTLYLAPRLVRSLPRTCCVLHVSPLLEQLVLHACASGMLDRKQRAQSHVLSVICDQLAAAPSIPLQLPRPRDARALRVVAALEDRPSDRRPLSALCRRAGASKRTVERAFLEETGMTFGKWRQQLALVHGMRLVACGAKVTSAALDAGYESPSAFIAMFRRALGTTPSRYFQETRIA
jgi:AraC-like DNA-binding protein/quercetin dioxygenase-like cupin family protein